MLWLLALLVWLAAMVLLLALVAAAKRGDRQLATSRDRGRGRLWLPPRAER
jgi:hypothetical protein